MHRYELLEKRWKKYRLKRVLKPLFFILTITLLSIGAFYFAKKSATEEKKKEVVTHTSQNILLPAKEFEKRLDGKKFYQKRKAVAKKAQKKARISKNGYPHKVLISNKRADIKELEKNFYSHPTYSKAILLAQRYFDEKDYKRSLHWALKANEINKEDERSWIIFAKNLVKLNKKDKAARVLKTYILHHGSSQEAKEMLKKIYGR